jgi:hypothetical protein
MPLNEFCGIRPLASRFSQEDVLIEPVIRNLDINDVELKRKIQTEISGLYDFFKKLYDQDQQEIRCAACV